MKICFYFCVFIDLLGEILKYVDIDINGITTRIFEINGLKVGVALSIGPRILYLSLLNEDYNLFNILPEISLETPDGIWMIYGGHRLWTAPEDFPRTYSVDNKPVEVKQDDSRIIVIGNVELYNNILKKLIIEPGNENYALKIVHEIVNIGRWPIEFSCWALTVMKPSGIAIIPMIPRKIDKHGLLPDRVISIWPYTKLNDRRLIYGENYVLIKHDPAISHPIKIGVRAFPPVVAYWIKGYLFIKKIVEENSMYPDNNVYIEVYANDKIIELETLSPVRRVEPDGVNTHTEYWKVVKTSQEFDENIINTIIKYV